MAIPSEKNMKWARKKDRASQPPPKQARTLEYLGSNNMAHAICKDLCLEFGIDIMIMRALLKKLFDEGYLGKSEYIAGGPRKQGRPVTSKLLNEYGPAQVTTYKSA